MAERRFESTCVGPWPEAEDLWQRVPRDEALGLDERQIVLDFRQFLIHAVVEVDSRRQFPLDANTLGFFGDFFAVWH